MILDLYTSDLDVHRSHSMYHDRATGFELSADLTKDPAHSHHFKESQEYQGNHGCVVVHQLEHIYPSLSRKEKEVREGSERHAGCIRGFTDMFVWNVRSFS